MDGHTIVVVDGEAACCWIHADGGERHNPFLVRDPIDITEGERSLAEFGIPLDAAQEFSEWHRV